MRTDEFDYDLPPDRIAQTPVEPRDASRLMVVERASGRIDHRQFYDLPELLRPGDLLVANDSRVIPARLNARKESGGKVELLLLGKRAGDTWEALVKGRSARAGTKLSVGDVAAEIQAETPSGTRLIAFDRPIEPLLEQLGEMPLPPYIRAPLADPERYQTVYARIAGSAAAPTAGLHFTPALIERLRERGLRFAFVTLHIGLDTFRPVTEERVEEHQIHTEWAELSPATAEEIRTTKRTGGRVIAVGTTAVRVLETAARGGDIQPFSGPTSLYIYPGFVFRAVDAMITNFHLPRSTLLMLVSAFAGKELIERAYRTAIEEGYRFYSFGDAMLVE